MKSLFVALIVLLSSACITKKGITVSATSTGKVIEPSRLVPTTNGIFKLEKPVKLQPIKPPIAKVVPIKPDPATTTPEKNPKEVPTEKIAVPLEKPKLTTQPTKPQYVLPKTNTETQPEVLTEPIDLEVSKLIELNKDKSPTTFADLIYFYFSLIVFLLGLFLIYRLLKKKFFTN